MVAIKVKEIKARLALLKTKPWMKVFSGLGKKRTVVFYYQAQSYKRRLYV